MSETKKELRPALSWSDALLYISEVEKELSAAKARIAELEKEIEHLTPTYMKAERDFAEVCHTKALLKEAAEALEKIVNAGVTITTNQVPYPLRVNVESLKEMARQSLSKLAPFLGKALKDNGEKAG